jgi:hypothetical protein
LNSFITLAILAFLAALFITWQPCPLHLSGLIRRCSTS